MRKKRAARGRIQAFNPLVTSLRHPLPLIRMTTFTLSTTMQTTRTCSTSPTQRGHGYDRLLRTLEAFLVEWLSTSPSTQQRINLEFPTLTKMQLR